MGETLIMVAVMFALLYFMMIRPENKRKKEAQAMRDSLSVGDEITTIAELKIALTGGHANRYIVAHHLYRHHGHGFTLGGVDLTRHNGGTRLIFQIGRAHV